MVGIETHLSGKKLKADNENKKKSLNSKNCIENKKIKIVEFY